MAEMLENKKSTHQTEIVPVVLEKHPYADLLSIVNIYGYSCVVNTEQWKGVTKAAYIVPDSLVNVTRPEFDFLATEANALGQYRVKAKKIRKVVSYGLLIPVAEDAVIGDDYAERLGVTRYEPPEPSTSQKDKLVVSGEEEPAPSINTGPEKYDIDSFERYAYNHLEEGEPVFITEKLDGSNFRAVYHDGRYWVKSRTRWLRRTPDFSHVTFDGLVAKGVTEERAKEIVDRVQSKKGQVQPFWQELEKCEPLMKFLRDYEGVTVFGEIYGKTNRLKYGFKEGNRFAAFDIYGEGSFYGASDYITAVQAYNIPHAPIFPYEDGHRGYQIPYTFDIVKQLATGKTTVKGSNVIREGVVVRPIAERYAHRFGRVIFKSVNPEFLAMDTRNDDVASE